MIPKKNRISRKEFGQITKPKELFQSQHFSLRRTEGGNLTRVAVSVSKKISKSAVVRNTTRRRVYSALQKMIGELPSGLYFFSAKKGVEKIKGHDLEDEIRALLKKLKRG